MLDLRLRHLLIDKQLECLASFIPLQVSADKFAPKDNGELAKPVAEDRETRDVGMPSRHGKARSTLGQGLDREVRIFSSFTQQVTHLCNV